MLQFLEALIIIAIITDKQIFTKVFVGAVEPFFSVKFGAFIRWLQLVKAHRVKGVATHAHASALDNENLHLVGTKLPELVERGVHIFNIWQPFVVASLSRLLIVWLTIASFCSYI